MKKSSKTVEYCKAITFHRCNCSVSIDIKCNLHENITKKCTFAIQLIGYGFLWAGKFVYEFKVSDNQFRLHSWLVGRVRLVFALNDQQLIPKIHMYQWYKSPYYVHCTLLILLYKCQQMRLCLVRVKNAGKYGFLAMGNMNCFGFVRIFFYSRE